jgi:RNA polymerase sigma factor (TIGR02999 family)
VTGPPLLRSRGTVETVTGSFAGSLVGRGEAISPSEARDRRSWARPARVEHHRALAPVGQGVIRYTARVTGKPRSQASDEEEAWSESLASIAEDLSDSRHSLDALMPALYRELRRLASFHLRRERAGHTLSTTALAHEAYLRLAEIERIELEDRAHFFALASRMMRRVLIDHARRRNRQKRSGGWARITLDLALPEAGDPIDLLALDDALRRLEQEDARAARLVEYRFFGGLTLEEAAEVLGVSLSTAKRDWTLARAWLNRALG